MTVAIPSPIVGTGDGRVQVAEEAISHLASLTAQRDREQLDVTLAQGAGLAQCQQQRRCVPSGWP